MKFCYFVLVHLLLLSSCCIKSEKKTTVSADTIPNFSVDPYWPKPLPNNWLIGQVSGVAVDSRDHVWIIHRSKSIGEEEVSNSLSPDEYPFTPAPPVIEFDPEGNVVQAWGGPGEGFEWAESEHGLFVDKKGHVWIGGGGQGNHQVLKFNSNGSFLLGIGLAGVTGGNKDTLSLGFPTDFDVDEAANEIYVADGYVNNRIIVFDASTGKYKRHWGAYGKNPDDFYKPDTPVLQKFNTPHAVRISKDGFVYVADRINNRVQVFQKDGKFIFEEFISKNTSGLGSAWDIDFSNDPSQMFIYVADGTNQCIRILRRDNLKEAGIFGRMGRYAGQFIWVHNVATDSKGNIYTTEVRTGKRVQKFNYQSPD